MKILLDECIDWHLKKDLEPHETFTVKDLGWSGIVNGELLTKASQHGFKVFITVDKNIQFQQNLRKYNLAVVVFQTRFNRLEFIRLLIPNLLKKLPNMEAGNLYEIT